MTKPRADIKIARILIVDDHPLVRQGLSELISHEPDLEVCGEASAAGEAFQKVQSTRPDLVLIDLSLKDISGLELIKQIKAWKNTTKMLVVSMLDESIYAERALHAGAMGFVNKEEATEKVIEAVRDVLEGKVYLGDQSRDRVLHRVVGGKVELAEPSVHSLSDRELEVFELIGQGQTTKQIATRMRLSSKTVETHRDRIKAKLKLANITELTRRAVHWVLEKN